MCGVVGIVSTRPVAQSLYNALTVLQHRGQDAAGIVSKVLEILRHAHDERHMQAAFVGVTFAARKHAAVIAEVEDKGVFQQAVGLQVFKRIEMQGVGGAGMQAGNNIDDERNSRTLWPAKGKLPPRPSPRIGTASHPASTPSSLVRSMPRGAWLQVRP